MIPRKSPCYKCENRAEGCHGNCEKYAEYKDRARDAYEKRKVGTEANDFLAEQSIRRKKNAWQKYYKIKH